MGGLLDAQGTELEAAFAKDETLPDPENTKNLSLSASYTR